MNDPIYNNPNAPARAEIVNELFAAILMSAMEVEEYADNPTEVNSALGLCEIATALPTDWFSPEERAVVLGLVKRLHGDPREFLLGLMDGSLSYINAHGQQHMDGKHKTLQQVVADFFKAQEDFLAGV